MRRLESELGEPVAGGGLLHRRAFLRGGVAFAGAVTVAAKVNSAAAAPTIGAESPLSMTRPGKLFTGYGVPARSEEGVRRLFALVANREGAGTSRTPWHMLNGSITPSGLHFERHHNGVPDVDASRHTLLIHGLVKRPLVFTLATLQRYPMETRIHFIECAGNSGALTRPDPAQDTVGGLHGLLSCSEWTGVPVSVLLDEAGIDPRGKWVLAEGADAAGMSRSVPLAKLQDDAMIALYQNGEAVRPEQGYPMRLLLPGYEGNINVKWLRRLKVTEGPMHTRDETSKYTELMPDGKARQFTLPLGPKSVITHPSYGMKIQGPGYYEISGIAWSGAGRVRTVEVSADGGVSWATAALAQPVISKAVTRFRLPWRWSGQMTTLLSRAIDETGDIQPLRKPWMEQYAPGQGFHYNAMQLWAVDPLGNVKNTYA
ncbi:MAG: sulfite dehydrogenase [Alphaproteobacteria bacterium]|nr:sulfite dehydrogenase [Alphaproteobacteria bacterium]